MFRGGPSLERPKRLADVVENDVVVMRPSKVLPNRLIIGTLSLRLSKLDIGTAARAPE